MYAIITSISCFQIDQLTKSYCKHLEQPYDRFLGDEVTLVTNDKMTMLLRLIVRHIKEFVQGMPFWWKVREIGRLDSSRHKNRTTIDEISEKEIL